MYTKKLDNKENKSTGTNKNNMKEYEKQNYIKYLFDYSPDFQIILNGEGKIIRANQAFEEVTGKKREELIGSFIYEYIPEKTIKKLSDKIIKEKRIKNMEININRPGRELLIGDFSGVLFTNKEGETIIYLSGRDITERRKLQQNLMELNENLEKKVMKKTKELRKAQDQLIQSEKLSIIGELVTGVVHEVRNPLATISLIVQHLEKKVADNYQIEKLQAIQRNISRIDKIVYSLLNFSHPPRSNFDHHNVNEILERLEPILKHFLPENIKIIKKYDSKLPLGWFDSDCLEQVFLNLISNAIRAMKYGGELYITTSFDSIRKGIIIRFEDTGVGIPEGNLKKIFNPFFTTYKEGTGLGLSICQNIINEHKGNISVESKLGKGTIFTISLPLEKRNEKNRGGVGGGCDIMTKANILIIDDEVDLCQSLLELLEEEEYKVFIAHSGKEGLIKVKENLPDLVLLDIKMTGIDGIETLERITAINKDISVIMLTAYQTVETAVKAMKLGAYDYISKPFNYEELKIIIKRALQAHDLSQEVISLRHQLRDKFNFKNIIGKSDKIKEVLYKIEKVAPTNATVLIRGESGSGKELIAKTIHQYSPRRDRPFIAVDCASLPETLIESELFGHTKGAFTGAIAKRIGKFELAQSGTFFLDEIGNLPVNIQAKLLRALQEGEINRIGEKYPIKIDVRMIIASNTDLEEDIKRGTFREDLYYRINVFSIFLPTLKERKEDIPLLALHFLNQFNPIFGKSIKNISEESIKLLINYSWPGNVRELQNVIQQAIIMAEDIILPEHLPFYIRENKVEAVLVPTLLSEKDQNNFPHDFSLKKNISQLSRDAERRIILEVLKRTNWNKAKAARLLKINYKTLYLKIKEYDLHPTNP